MTNNIKKKVMETKIIARVNNVDIVSTSDEQLVAIKPICEALGIDVDAQRQKLKEDPDLSSVAVLSTATGADGKRYEMCCLPVEFIYGWLFTINPKNVKPEAQAAVRKYRMMCYRALYRHFTGDYKRVNEQNKIEIALLEKLADLNRQQQDLKQAIADRRKKLEQLRDERLKCEPMLF